MAGEKYGVYGTFLKESDIAGANIVKEPWECSVEELKRWLECHGQKKSGRNHELVERVKGLLKLNIKVDPKMGAGHWHNVKSSINKENNDSIDFLIPQVGWKIFPSQDIPINFN